MKLKLNRFTAGLLLILLSPIVLAIKLLNAVTGRGKKPTYIGTIEGDPLGYDGDRPLLIAVWATWASIWQAATENVVQQLKDEFSGKCEFAYVECANRAVRETYGVDVVPVLILRRHGQELGRFVNTLEAEDVRKAISECVASG